MPRCPAIKRDGLQCGFDGLWPCEHGTLCGIHARAEHAHVECAICLSDDTVTSKSVTLRCGHTYCRKCINRWTHRGNATCPTCRRGCLDIFRRHTLAASFAAYFRAMKPITRKMDTNTVRMFVLFTASSDELQTAWNIGPEYPPTALMVLAMFSDSPREFVWMVRRWHQQDTSNDRTPEILPVLKTTL